MQLILNKISSHRPPRRSPFPIQVEAQPVLRSSSQRLITFLGELMRTRVTALSVVVVTATGLASSATLAQTTAAAAPAEAYSVPRLSWGDADLQGVWDYRTITPMERRPELGDRAYYTDEEVAQLDGKEHRMHAGHVADDRGAARGLHDLHARAIG